MIKQHDQIPSGALTSKGDLGIQHYDPKELFAKGRHIVFAVPGAFTPTCSEKHLPGYARLADQFASAEVKSINCVAVNDAFVMKAWGDQLGIGDEVRLLSDGNGEYTDMLGLATDTGAFGGIRSKRYAMVIEDGIIEHLFIEEEKQFDVSSAEHVLQQLSE